MKTVARRHYRTAKKQIEYAPNRGVFLSKRKKPLYLAIGIGVLAITFLNGFLAGLAIGRD